MDTIITTIIDWTVVPLTAPIPFLASSGILLAVFAVMWLAFGIALARNRTSLDDTWAWIRRQNLVVQLAAWLLFLPVLAGLWIWRRSWPVAWRLIVIGGLAGWNLLVFLPQHA